MPEISSQVEIPKRALFRAAEVCDLVKVQPYVLRSWESEFPELGVAKSAGAPRVYRRVDVEQVLRIKHLLLVEGLTLAGARRRLEEEAAPIGADAPLDELIGQNARERITEVKRGLQALLYLLGGGGERANGGGASARVKKMSAGAGKRARGQAARQTTRRTASGRGAKKKRRPHA